MARRPIAIDACTDGSAEGVGGVEPGPSIDHGGDGARIDQVFVPMFPRPSARNQDSVRHRVVNESAGFPRVSNPSAGSVHFLWCTRRRL